MKILFVVALTALFAVSSCSKKNHPAASASNEKTATVKKETAPKPVIKTPPPKVITVDDRAAKKTPDGRMYYDLEGHRYWRNYDDGKYYLYSKSMYKNPAFKPHR